MKVVPLNGGEPRELWRDVPAQYLGLQWTNDGRYIITYTRSTTQKGEIWRIPTQGGTPLKLEIAVPRMISFALHPDNCRFACGVVDERKFELWVLENFPPNATLAAK